jgi:hypothetical protein
MRVWWTPRLPGRDHAIKGKASHRGHGGHRGGLDSCKVVIAYGLKWPRKLSPGLNGTKIRHILDLFFGRFRCGVVPISLRGLVSS